MTEYVLAWTLYRDNHGGSAEKENKTNPYRRTYSDLDKARAACRRKMNYHPAMMIQCATGIYEITAKGSKLVGEVYSMWDYNYGNANGVFWVPAGKAEEGYRASGVSADGTLNKIKYKLT